MAAATFIARRIGIALLVVFAVATLAFFVDRALPADPARAIAGQQARPQDVERIRQQLGLRRPLIVQYVVYLRRLVHFGPVKTAGPRPAAHASCGSIGPLHVDLGRSYQQRRPVIDVLVARLPYTVALALVSIALSVAIGVATGLLAAAKRGTWIDSGIVAATILGISAPTFLLGIALQWLFGHRLGWLPINGAGNGFADHARHIALPALTLGLFNAAFYTRLVRADVVELLRADHVRTARAKGLGPLRVLLAHTLRNAAVPLVTMIGLDLGALLGGAVVTEAIFAWPGVGALAVRALADRDGPVIMGTVLVAATAVVTASLVVDLLYVVLDPRMRRRR